MDNEHEYTLTDLLKYSYQEKPVDFANAFNSLIGDKLEAAISTKKLEIAQGIFSGAPEEVQEYEYEDEYETEAPEVEDNGEIA